MKKIMTVALALSTVLSLNACAPRVGGSNYSVSGAGEVTESYRGVIVGMRSVTISANSPENENQPGVGAAAGALAGGFGGAQIGGGRGSIVAAGVGALAGGIAGHMLEKNLTDQQGVEYQVKLDDGRIMTVAQGAEPAMRTGQRVLVIPSRVSATGKVINRGRVVPDNTVGY